MNNEPVILLVEDFPHDVRVLRAALEQTHLNNPVREACNGEEALAYLKGEGKYANRQLFPLPVLVVLDLKLPKMSGLDVLRWIHEQRTLRSLVRVALISPENLGQFREAWDLGVTHFLVKPLDQKEVLDLILMLSKDGLWFHSVPPPVSAPGSQPGADKSFRDELARRALI